MFPHLKHAVARKHAMCLKCVSWCTVLLISLSDNDMCFRDKLETRMCFQASTRKSDGNAHVFPGRSELTEGNASVFPAGRPHRVGNAYVFKMCFFVFPEKVHPEPFLCPRCTA